MNDSSAIGVFDSGLGGLTVLKELLIDLPYENFIYLGDTARLPYGAKSQTTILNYLQQNIKFLLQQDVKAIVVACNSASSVLTANLEFPVPVYSVIAPGARAAAISSENACVGVIGTRATITQKAYLKALHLINPKLKVFQQACPLLVPLVEEGLLEDPLTNLILFRYLNPLIQSKIDTLILGCTHYPTLNPAIEKVIGRNIQLIDSAGAISQELQQDLTSGKINSSGQNKKGFFKILTTDLNDYFYHIAAQIMSPVPIHNIEHVNL